jgi:glutaminyl-tRNA synthetase
MSDTESPRPSAPPSPSSTSSERPPNFLEEIVEADVAAKKNGGRVVTRFPPEPNGYLHIGHAKAICLNFGLAAKFGGTTNLRFDDTNPSTEDVEYVESIQEDIRWLGFDWKENLYFASDYFEQLYAFALEMIASGKAYVDSSTLDEIRAARGNFYKPGVESPHRARSIEENVDLFKRMRAGEFADGAHVLRAKIDMASPNQNLRDPVMYRIKREHHHRTGDAWPIYPMYDFAHGLSDAVEGVTHSICTLEFENHRPLYDWFLDQVTLPKTRPEQIEFAKLNITYTVQSKRKLKELVVGKHVSGWDDPRMPTLAGLRRRGVTPVAIRAFCERVGVAKRNSMVDVALLEHAIREDLNATSKRVMGVLRPLKIVIENFPEGHVEDLEAPFHPENPSAGSRKVPLSRELYIEREDFAEVPPKGFFRLSPGKEVRLRYACLVTCIGVEKNEAGEVVLVRCTWDPDSRGGEAKDGRKVKATLHWVSAPHAVKAEARLYDRLFVVEDPLAEVASEGGASTTEGTRQDFLAHLNPRSCETLPGAFVEPSVAGAAPGARFQLERVGYFAVDVDSTPGKLVLNRTIALRDAWAASQAPAPAKAAAPKK